MQEPMRKLRTETVTVTVTGPAENMEKAMRALTELGFADTSDSVPWREAFPEYDEKDLPGLYLAAARDRENMTQKRLSELTGIPRRHISEMERGKRTIGKKAGKILGKVLKVDHRVFL
ncbi:helix-turn-helix domain-containing protein [Desulfonema magnum]|uniref:HTH domain-containing protein, Cro/C1-type n=1 Tax=Desulfonema magnum TaxID=45655 RepID=A0A975GL35_9BACT|nr:helix-turn-helix transcriptional regulator [Desulfonema magnum]QTA85155.1 HTH domain-containing protein, Cro/C1-type [Desulfonema magnum]